MKERSMNTSRSCTPKAEANDQDDMSEKMRVGCDVGARYAQRL